MVTDILFDPVTGNILIQKGELVVGDSTDQHTSDIVWSDKAWWKFSPRLGVGLINYMNDSDGLPNLSASIRKELSDDGQNVQSVQIQDGGQLVIQTSYPS